MSSASKRAPSVKNVVAANCLLQSITFAVGQTINIGLWTLDIGLGTAASDEMNDLDAIVLTQRCLSPKRPTDNLVIEFDSHAFRSKFEIVDQLSQGR